MDAVCLTPEERKRLAALYPPDPEPEPAPGARLAPQVAPGGRRGAGRGEDHHGAVLTEEQVKGLRRKAAKGIGYAILAKEIGVDRITALHAIRGKTWSWMKDPAPVTVITGGLRAAARGDGHHKAVLTRELVCTLRREVAAGAGCASVARRLGVHKNTALHAVIGATWGWLEDPPPVVAMRAQFTVRLRHLLASNVLTKWKAAQLAERLGGVSTSQVYMALQRLMTKGEVEKLERGVYRARVIASSCQVQ